MRIRYTITLLILFINNSLSNVANVNGNTPLYISYFKVIKPLIKSGASLNSKNKNANTPIYGYFIAVILIIEILLSTNRIKLDFINNFGDSTIIDCCRLGHSKTLQLLLNYIGNKEFVLNYKSKLIMVWI